MRSERRNRLLAELINDTGEHIDDRALTKLDGFQEVPPKALSAVKPLEAALRGGSGPATRRTRWLLDHLPEIPSLERQRLAAYEKP